MAGIGRIISVAVGLLALNACGPRYDFAGTWKGRADTKGAPGADPIIVANYNRVVLTLKVDGTFEVFESGFPKSGNWSASGNQATLHVRSMLGQPYEGPKEGAEMRLEAVEPNSIVFVKGMNRVILKREAQPGQ